MSQRLRLLAPALLLSVMVLKSPPSVGSQTPSSQPAATPSTESENLPSHPKTAPSPQYALPGSSAAPADALPRDRETIVRLKVFLDQRSFGPGEIDDHWNDLCLNALRLYQAANGRGATESISPELREELSRLAPLYVNYQIKPEDLIWVGKVTQKPALQAKRKSMPYPSMADFVAERFHTSVPFLTSLNRGKNLNRLHPGDVLQVPNVPPLEVSMLKQADDVPPRPALKNHSIEIDTKTKILAVMEGETELAAFPITPGSKALPAPIGTWQIVKIATLPWFRWDKAMLLHGKRSADFYNIPLGPRNEVGLVWIGLNKKGIGIHGTNNPGSIGRSSSHGCIRLANWDAVRVLDAVTQGATVRIK
jgi:lipoprotein-anchoring transpeptidase ErfK/SrfK